MNLVGLFYYVLHFCEKQRFVIKKVVFKLLPCLVCAPVGIGRTAFAAAAETAEENAVGDSALHGEMVMEVSPLDNDRARNCNECFLNCKYCWSLPRLAAATISARISGGNMNSEPLEVLDSLLCLVSNLEKEMTQFDQNRLNTQNTKRTMCIALHVRNEGNRQFNFHGI